MMHHTRQDHWDRVYGSRADAALTWFQADPRQELDIISQRVGPGEAIIDIGAGASRLVDGLLARGLGPVTLLDISPAALQVTRTRLGKAAEQVTWLSADITRWTPPATYALWHDRAVFHFLTDAADRAAYVAAMARALKPGAHALLATFALDGPETCSGLPVERYSPTTLAAELERQAPGAFRLIEGQSLTHVTPKGNRQNFQLSLFQRR